MIFEKLQLDNALNFVRSRIEDVTDDRLLKRLKKQELALTAWGGWLGAGPAPVPILPSDERELYPCSAALRHFWIGFLFEKSHVPFNVVTTNFIPDLDVEAFKKTCTILIERHEVFRTVAVFDEENRTVLQKVLPRIDVDQVVWITDISTNSREVITSLIETRTESAKAHIFLYSDGPSFYFELLKCDENDYLVIFNISHVFFDGFSKDLFEAEFLSIYEAVIQGREHKLKPTVVSFRDFCQWEKNYQSHHLQERFAEYWYAQQKRRFPLKTLSTHFNRSLRIDDSYRIALKRRIIPYLRNTDDETIAAFYGVVAKAERTRCSSYRFVLTGKVFYVLNALCKRRLVTAYPVIVTVLKILIYKITGEDDIILGANIAIRDRDEFQRLIAFLVNTILIRDKIDGAHCFEDLLTDVILNLSLASSFKAYTMSKVLDDMDIPFNAINTIFLNMLPARNESDLRDISVRHQEDAGHGYFDIDLHIQQYRNGIEILCNYDFSVYKKETITSLCDQFSCLLELCLIHPETVINEISLTNNALIQ